MTTKSNIKSLLKLGGDKSQQERYFLVRTMLETMQRSASDVEQVNFRNIVAMARSKDDAVACEAIAAMESIAAEV